MRMFRTLTCLSALLCAVGCGDSPTVENLSDAGAGMQGGKSPIKQSPAERLAGTYVSDRAASIAFLESTGHYDADKLASFGSVFGKMEITYRGDTRTTVIDGQVAQHKFTIVDSGPNHVTIECKWSQVEGAIVGEDSEINRIEFTDDGFWLGNQEIPMNQFKEKFVRKESAKTRDKETVPNDFPDQPLVVGGGTDNIVQANPEYVAQNEPPRRFAHFEFVVDPSLKAHEPSVSSGNVPDKFVWQARRKYRIEGKTHALDYSLDGRTHTLSAGGKTFELAKGNYFRFYILPGPSLLVDQLPVVDTIGDAASEDVQSRVGAVYDAHPSRTEIPKASRTAIPEVKTDFLSPVERNLKKLSEQLLN